MSTHPRAELADRRYCTDCGGIIRRNDEYEWPEACPYCGALMRFVKAALRERGGSRCGETPPY